MSVIMTMWLRADPKQVEEYAGSNRETMQSIVESAKQHGVLAHRFYGSEGQVMVIDEWPDAESFQSFFEENRDRIEPIMQAAGAQGEPGVNFWEKLDTGDDYGWGA